MNFSNKLTADPNSISLRKPIKMISLNDIIPLSKVQNDEIFIKNYIKFLNGKKNVYISRLSLSKIKIGFYKRDTYNKKWRYILDDIDHEHLKIIKREIKTGDRPALHLYENPNKKCSFPFVCPDDVVVHKAYDDLGINKVPIILIGTKKGLEESAFIQKMFPDIERNSYYIYSTINLNTTKYQSLLGKNLDINIIDGISKLEEYFIKLKEDLQSFHTKGNNKIHYHEMLYSIILRILEMLKSIKLLLKEGLTFQASTILRSLYELSLNFYVSWLSPHDMAIMLQTSSVLSKHEREKVSQYIYKEQITAGLDHKFANDIKEAQQYLYDFSDKIIEKAKLSPLGEDFYKNVYSFLSNITHHDFSMVARYKNALEHGDDVIYDIDILTSILRMTDASVSMIYIRLKDDIGCLDN